MTGGEEVAFLTFGLIVTDRVGGVCLVPVVPTLPVHSAVKAHCIALLVVGQTLWTVPAIAVAGGAAC